MSALDKVLGRLEKAVNSQKPGIIDAAVHRELLACVELLEQYQKLYSVALAKVQSGIELATKTRENDLIQLKLLSARGETPTTANGASEKPKQITYSAVAKNEVNGAMHPARSAAAAAASAASAAAANGGIVAANAAANAAVAPKQQTMSPHAPIFTHTEDSRAVAPGIGLHSRPQRITVSPSISMDAIVVITPDAVRQDGYLYYISTWDHFALRINGHLFHGNIGVIYDRPSDSIKTADCKYKNCRHRATCAYYHDPSIFPGSNERRNYYNAALTYSPSDSPRGRSMHFGSFSNIENDINHVDATSASMMRDHTMHDLLCAMIAMNRAQKTPAH